MSDKIIKSCCTALDEAINDETILYNIPQRLYYIPQKNLQNNWYVLLYCPFCGMKLPINLSDEYFEVIRDPESGKILDPLPKEFKSDEWWKKRGL